MPGVVSSSANIAVTPRMGDEARDVRGNIGSRHWAVGQNVAEDRRQPRSEVGPAAWMQQWQGSTAPVIEQVHVWDE